MKQSIINFLVDNKDYLEDFITRSTYNSNGIEGSTLTYAETYAIIYNDNSFKIQGKEPREIYEAINHKKALEYMLEKLKGNDLLNDIFIKDLNKIINKDIKEIEGYRKVPVFIRGTDYIPPEPEKLQNLMFYFIDNYNNFSNDDIFLKIAKFHIDFERIHPFEDGNGRTGRLLINYELLQNNIPPIVISKEDRTKYFELLQNEDIEELAIWFEQLSLKEEERLKIFRL